MTYPIFGPRDHHRGGRTVTSSERVAIRAPDSRNGPDQQPILARSQIVQRDRGMWCNETHSPIDFVQTIRVGDGIFARRWGLRNST